MFKVFINPGHSSVAGEDHGACHNNLQESDITLAVSNILASKLTSKGYSVQVFQHDDLAKVCDTANAFQANLFISIHCDAFTSPSAGGTSAFWFSGSKNSEKFGTAARHNIASKLNLTERSNHDGSNFYVCKHTAMPAVLLELAFISNPKEAELLSSKQEDFADAIAEAVNEYFK